MIACTPEGTLSVLGIQMGKKRKEKYVSTRIKKNLDFIYRIPDDEAKVLSIVPDNFNTENNQLFFSNESIMAGPQPAFFHFMNF